MVWRVDSAQSSTLQFSKRPRDTDLEEEEVEAEEEESEEEELVARRDSTPKRLGDLSEILNKACAAAGVQPSEFRLSSDTYLGEEKQQDEEEEDLDVRIETSTEAALHLLADVACADLASVQSPESRLRNPDRDLGEEQQQEQEQEQEEQEEQEDLDVGTETSTEALHLIADVACAKASTVQSSESRLSPVGEEKQQTDEDEDELDVRIETSTNALRVLADVACATASVQSSQSRLPDPDLREEKQEEEENVDGKPAATSPMATLTPKPLPVASFVRTAGAAGENSNIPTCTATLLPSLCQIERKLTRPAARKRRRKECTKVNCRPIGNNHIEDLDHVQRDASCTEALGTLSELASPNRQRAAQLVLETPPDTDLGEEKENVRKEQEDIDVRRDLSCTDALENLSQELALNIQRAELESGRPLDTDLGEEHQEEDEEKEKEEDLDAPAKGSTSEEALKTHPKSDCAGCVQCRESTLSDTDIGEEFKKKIEMYVVPSDGSTDSGEEDDNDDEDWVPGRSR
ncbi:unnamed protein product [Calypogeia fissa]